MTDPSYPPFDSNAELIDAWLIALRQRRLRVEVEQPEPHRLWKAARTREGNVAIEDIYEREKAAWADLQGRLEAHRRDDESPTLGLELLRGELGLDDDEMVILAAVAICAISETLAAEALGLSASSFGLSVNSLMALLGPDPSPWQIEDWLRWRALFQPGSKLIEAGLIEVDYEPDGNPGELLDSYVSVTRHGFKALTGAAP